MHSMSPPEPRGREGCSGSWRDPRAPCPGLAHLWAAVRLRQLDTGLVQAGHIPIPVLLLVVGCPGRPGRGKQGCFPGGKRKAASLPLHTPVAWALLPSPGQSLGKQSPGQVLVPAVRCAAPSYPGGLREPPSGLAASLGWGAPLLTQSTAPQRGGQAATEQQQHGEGGTQIFWSETEDPAFFGVREGTPPHAGPNPAPSPRLTKSRRRCRPGSCAEYLRTLRRCPSSACG